jgi:hypothetical protein
MPFLTLNPADIATAASAAQAGIPPPGGGGTPSPMLGQLAASGLAGVQQPGAVPGAQYTGGIAGAQGAPNPANISGAGSGLAHILANYLPPAPAPIQSLGAYMRGAGVVR